MNWLITELEKRCERAEIDREAWQGAGCEPQVTINVRDLRTVLDKLKQFLEIEAESTANLD